MDSLSCAPPLAAEPAAQADAVFIAAFGDPVAADYAAFVTNQTRAAVVLLTEEQLSGGVPLAGAMSLVLFIGARLDAASRRDLERLWTAARARPLEFIAVVSSFRVHLDDRNAAALEAEVAAAARGAAARVTVFRPGHVLSPCSAMSKRVQRLASVFPLITPCLRTCFLDGEELFNAIERERRAVSEAPRHDREAGRAVSRRNREYTLLGANLPWRAVVAERRGTAFSLSAAACVPLAWLGLGHLFAFCLRSSARLFPSARQWYLHTIRPSSRRELLALCHPQNSARVRVVGYNNGVHHFGQRYPGKTIVSTVRCHQLRVVGQGVLRADCGATIRQALDFLAERDRELYVVPNYSYVCLGTAFFVPIHGSAVDYSTVADTIRAVVFYDPATDRIFSAKRDDPAFREYVYDQRSRVVVLRVELVTKPKSRYFVHRETLTRPTAAALLQVLHDRSAANVEIRQGHAASAQVTVARYYQDPKETSAPALELPRDALGRLWDRLEENPLTAYAMHFVGRHLVWHAELFFNDEEFERFWRTHSELPLRKIQLRVIRRDGLPHSPFRVEDCVSADLFMFRRNKARFEAYLRANFPTIRTNPGKHSS